MMLAGSAVMAQTSSKSTETTRVVGTWKLHSITEPPGPQGETINWMGAKPSGILVYSPTGYVSIQITRDPPATTRLSNRDDIPPGDALDALKGYYSYYGRYEVDSNANTIRHHVDGSL